MAMGMGMDSLITTAGQPTAEADEGRRPELVAQRLQSQRLLSQRLKSLLRTGCWLSLLLMPLLYGQAAEMLRMAGVTEELFGVPQVGVGVRDGLEYYVNPNKRGDTAAHTFGVNTLDNLPPSAVVLAEWYTDTDEYFVLRYFTVVERRRPDVEIRGWPLEDPFGFDPALATAVVAAELPVRPVYLASLSPAFYDAHALLSQYCIVPENNLYRVYPRGEERPCLEAETRD
jgi:hypothetical protein